ncbi:MAG: hypothetical protein WDN26_23305 [Chitinophagaceae bacterium]
MNILQELKRYEEQPLTKQILLDLLKEYKRPYDKINEMVKQGQLLLVKRGIYIPGPAANITPPANFLLANHILGPSYISLDAALSWWGLIPEKVVEITSVAPGSGTIKIYKTPAGRYSYKRIPLPYYSYGIKQVELGKKQTVLMGSPEKALCDKIITTPGILLRSTKQVTELLLEDLRIEKPALRNLNLAAVKTWLKHAPKKDSLKMLVKTLSNL